MCGIVGFIASKSMTKEPLAVLDGMLSRIAYRGPDSSGVWSESGVFLGHRRLAVVDLSPAGHQPMTSSNGRYVIVYNGEIYNFAELRRWLDDRGTVNWHGTSDTEVLVELIARIGFVAALERLTGMFSIAVWDRTEKVLHLARDRFGEKPLYYAQAGGNFYFASEIKALEAAVDLPKQIDRRVAALFLQRGHVPSPYSIYEGIFKIPPGCHLSFSKGTTEGPTPYWSFYETAQRGLANPFTDMNDYVDALEAALSASCQQQMLADVPLGAFLSGGVDSSTIVALMQKNAMRPVKTFAIGFENKEFDESSHARAVATHLGTDHTEQIVTEMDSIAVAPQLCKIYDEPFGDASAIPTYLVSKLARAHVTVSLSGDGGDELFAGYDRYAAFPEFWNLINRIPGLNRSGPALRRIPPGFWNAIEPIVKRLYSRTGGPGSNLAAKVSRISKVVGAKDFASFYYLMMGVRGNDHLIKDAGIPLSPPDSYQQAMPDQLSWMTFCDTMDYLPNDILVKVDRAAMAVSLEGRVPFLSADVAALAWRAPPGGKIFGKTAKFPLRQVLSRHVPRALFERPKMGFGVPLQRWLRGPLRDWAQDMLSDANLASTNLFDSAAVRQLHNEFHAGEDGDMLKLWYVLMLQSWALDRGL